LEIPEILIPQKEKLSILDKVLISAFKEEKLINIYEGRIIFNIKLFRISIPSNGYNGRLKC
jgi:hypothetical protein